MTGVSKPRENDAFCVIGNVGGKLKDAAMRCVLIPVDASKSVCGRGPLGSLQRSPDPLAGFWRGKWRRRMERAGMERERKGKERTL